MTQSYQTFTILLPDEAATQHLAQSVAPLLQPVDCLTLSGTLGTGKTTFMRHLLMALGVHEQVISPSFMLMQEYPVTLPASKQPAQLWHVDGYRIEDPAEIPELGIEEIAESAILCIEWPENFLPFLPDSRMEVTLKHQPDGTREAMLTAQGAAEGRIERLATTYDTATP